MAALLIRHLMDPFARIVDTLIIHSAVPVPSASIPLIATARRFMIALLTGERQTMYKAIVVGTDGSDRAGIAVAHAIALAKMSGAKLHVVHAARPDAMAGAGLDPAVIAVAEANRAYDHGDHICAQALAQATHEGVSADMHNADGNPADVLISIAESTEADLVVVGSRGMGGAMRFLLGSVSNKLSHHCPCNLLIVKADSAEK